MLPAAVLIDDEKEVTVRKRGERKKLSTKVNGGKRKRDGGDSKRCREKRAIFLIHDARPSLEDERHRHRLPVTFPSDLILASLARQLI